MTVHSSKAGHKKASNSKTREHWYSVRRLQFFCSNFEDFLSRLDIYERETAMNTLSAIRKYSAGDWEAIRCLVEKDQVRAIGHGWRRLPTVKTQWMPVPRFMDRRGWVKVAIVHGIIHVILMPTLVLLNIEKFRGVLELLRPQQDR